MKGKAGRLGGENRGFKTMLKGKAELKGSTGIVWTRTDTNTKDSERAVSLWKRGGWTLTLTINTTNIKETALCRIKATIITKTGRTLAGGT